MELFFRAVFTNSNIRHARNFFTAIYRTVLPIKLECKSQKKKKKRWNFRYVSYDAYLKTRPAEIFSVAKREKNDYSVNLLSTV